MKNEIILHDNYAEVVVLNRKKQFVTSATIDLNDVERVSKYAWSYNKVNGYFQNTRSYHETGRRYQHQFIIGRVEGFDIDHINRNKRDNTKINLRHVTRSVNKMNVEYKGVCWDKSRSKWMAYIQVNGDSKYLGRFDTFEEAKSVRLAAEEKYFVPHLEVGA